MFAIADDNVEPLCMAKERHHVIGIKLAVTVCEGHVVRLGGSKPRYQSAAISHIVSVVEVPYGRVIPCQTFRNIFCAVNASIIDDQ